MKLYKFTDGERHHIAARNEAEARACFEATYDDAKPDSYDVVEIPREQWALIAVNDDNVAGGKTSAAAIICDPDNERDAFMVCSTCV